MTNSTMTPEATEFACSYERDGETCWIFPFPTQAKLNHHLANEAHSFPSDIQIRQVAFDSPLRKSFGGGTGAPVAPYEPTERDAEAIAFAKTYEGTFEFMVSMREKAQRATFRPSPKMVDAILRCKAAHKPVDTPEAPAGPVAAPTSNLASNRYPGACVKCGGQVAAEAGHRDKVDGRWVVLHREGDCGTVVAETPRVAAPSVDVPAGHYAVNNEHGTLAFYRVDRPTEGKWAGYTFVKVHASDELHPIRGAAAQTILAKIAADADAGPRYGREIGRCCRCNRTLTDETSRMLGIGPDCRGKS